MAVLERVPYDRITEQARQVQFTRTVLTILAGLLYAVGWVAAKTLAGIWLTLTWSATAVRLGWVEARTSTRRS